MPKACLRSLVVGSLAFLTSVGASLPARATPDVAGSWEHGDADRVIRVGGARLRLTMTGGPHPLPNRVLEAWVRRAAGMVADYYGRFPVPELEVRIEVRRSGAVGFGQHFGGRLVRVNLGRDATPADLEDDWVMVHEMLHAAFPRVPRRHRWMQEGLSTYLESVLRARAGVHTEAQVWARWLRRMPYGVPRPSDRGLSRTSSWASLYWGGALFWLMADVEIRRRTGNERALRDAVAAILRAGGSGRVQWDPERILRIGDRATGTTVLSDLYAGHALERGDVDLERLWRRLGVRRDARGRIDYDEDAPLATVARSMNARVHRLPPMPSRP